MRASTCVIDEAGQADALPTLHIGPALIGGQSPAYVIAEAGVNHNGDERIAREMIQAAADAKADAVKFQVFSADRLVTRQAPAARYQQDATQASGQYDLLARLELTHDEFAALAEYAGRCGVEFLATPFSIDDLAFLVRIGVRAIKLASPDIVNVPLLEAAAGTGLPVIASTGAADLAEVASAVERFQQAGGGPLALMHCVSAYPATEEQANLAAIGLLGRRFSCVSGFSDHTESLTIGGFARAAGACIIEKHFTLDRRQAGPDHAFSLEPAQLAEYIGHIRYAERLLGNGALAVAECEREVRDLARGSVVAARDIRPGEVLTRAMLTVKRPGGGIAPARLDDLIGRKVSVPIAVDTPLAWEFLS
ncbi:MAG: N-acetylneuraminate synthase [Phycisphaerales bacterium]|nr:N-acetylneuraminate synthase [Phycisphaerales bacterium]